MKGVYPDGFEDWEITAIEGFRHDTPAVYEWRQTFHLIVENFGRPRGTVEQLEAVRARSRMDVTL